MILSSFSFFKLDNRHFQSRDHSIHYKWSIVTMRLSCTVIEICHLKDNGVMILTFCGHVTSSVTWPFDSRGSSSYPSSIVTMGLSGTVTEIWRLKNNRVTTLIFWGHVTSSVTWPFDFRESTSYGSSIVTMRLFSTVMEIWPFEFLPGRLFQEQRSVVGRSSVGRSVFNITLIYATLGT